MAAEAIVGILIFLVLAAAFYGPWQWICTDVARQIVFQKRDAIFDLACEGKLSFKSDEYRTIRRSLEKTIRFAHELNLPRFLYALWTFRPHPDAEPTELRAAMDRIHDNDVRHEVELHVSIALLAVLGMMIAKSPLGLFIVIPVALISHFVPMLMHFVRQRVTKIGELIQMEAEATDRFRTIT